MTSNFELYLLRLSLDGHLPEWRKERSSCIWCRYLEKKKQTDEKKILKKKNSTDKNPPQSQIYCVKCNVALYCSKGRSDCFKNYHIREEN